MTSLSTVFMLKIIAFIVLTSKIHFNKPNLLPLFGSLSSTHTMSLCTVLCLWRILFCNTFMLCPVPLQLFALLPCATIPASFCSLCIPSEMWNKRGLLPILILLKIYDTVKTNSRHLVPLVACSLFSLFVCWRGQSPGERGISNQPHHSKHTHTES